MKLIFLGTSSGQPTKNRNVTGLALDLSGARKEVWLFDCGEGTQHQILHSSIHIGKINKIFISHLHGDHIFGLPGLLSSRAMAAVKRPLTLYGPVGIADFIHTALQISQSHLCYELKIIEGNAGVLLDEGDFKVTAYALQHRIESFGFRIEQANLPRTINTDLLEQNQIPKGPWLQDLKQGQDIVLDDGRTVHAADYLWPEKPGLCLAIFGDTTPCDNSILLAQDVDVMVHETTHEHALADKALQYGHSTTTQAANIAKAANAKCLIATHLSSRYGSEEDLAKLLAECQAIFPNSHLAVDGLVFEV